VAVENEKGTFLYFSGLLGGPVRDAATGSRLGSLREIAFRTDARYPRASRLFYRRALFGGFFEAPWSAVREVTPGDVRVDPAAASAIQGRPEAGAGELLLECDVLDQQVVDTDGAKVVRVNDVHLFLLGTELHLAHVDIGARGLLRRLGYERLVVGGVRLLADVRMADQLVAWKHLHLLPSGVEDPHRATAVKLNVSQGRLADLHPADVADLLEDLDAPTRDRVFGALPTEAAADALEEARPEVAQEILGSVGEDKAAVILEAMDPGEAADLVREMPGPDAEAVLDAMEPEAAETVRALVTHSETSAGGLMTTRYLAVEPNWTALHALQEVRRHSADMEVFTYLYAVSPEGLLLGVVSLKELFTAPPRVHVRRLLHAKVVSVPVDALPGEVERLFAKYGFRAIPVVDRDGRMQGVVRLRKILEATGRGS
jgi:CBS domain-containing protein